jgi:hypothetical protein
MAQNRRILASSHRNDSGGEALSPSLFRAILRARPMLHLVQRAKKVCEIGLRRLHKIGITAMLGICTDLTTLPP